MRMRGGRALSLPLVAPVLEPDLHLRVAEPQRCGQPAPLGARQVLAAGERRLQRAHLPPAEHRARLLLPVTGDDDVTGRRRRPDVGRDRGAVDRR